MRSLMLLLSLALTRSEPGELSLLLVRITLRRTLSVRSATGTPSDAVQKHLKARFA